MSSLRDVISGFGIVVVSSVATIAVVACLAASMLAARPGEWSVPVRFGVDGFGIRLHASVASLLRVATHPLGIAFLDGRRHVAAAGTLRFARVDVETLVVDCAPCRMQVPGLGDEPIEIDALRITVVQRVDTLSGTVAAGAVVGHYDGVLAPTGLSLRIALDPAPIADYYALFGDRIPETRVAYIGGDASFTIRLALPHGRVEIEPVVTGFGVGGLGTERLSGRLPRVTCGGGSASTIHGPSRASDDRMGAWLPRAVVAAEDQRYYEHPGYDLAELRRSIERNQQASRIERGASTIPQQLARILFVGSERSGVRKLRELLYAVEMERTLGKARMLQLYLAVAPWGEHTCGAEAAAKRYFGTAAKSLNGAQAAWLAAMLHAPEREAERWTARGDVDRGRAAWVARGMRGIRATTRERILDDVASMEMRP